MRELWNALLTVLHHCPAYPARRRGPWTSRCSASSTAPGGRTRTSCTGGHVRATRPRAPSRACAWCGAHYTLLLLQSPSVTYGAVDVMPNLVAQLLFDLHCRRLWILRSEFGRRWDYGRFWGMAVPSGAACSLYSCGFKQTSYAPYPCATHGCWMFWFSRSAVH